ncbi:MAG: LON peptidase substrate-binding domain-containing protein, partial [Pseudomonadota bacterium]
MLQSYSLISEIPQRIPVFPLRGALLLPRATLPLNIFEPRYLAMIDEVLTGHRILGIVQPAGGDDGESPQGSEFDVRHVGCAGRLTAYQELDDGRLLITLTGVCRFKIRSECDDSAPYRCFNVDYSDHAHDLRLGSGEEEVDREQLHTVLK